MKSMITLLAFVTSLSAFASKDASKFAALENAFNKSQTASVEGLSGAYVGYCTASAIDANEVLDGLLVAIPSSEGVKYAALIHPQTRRAVDANAQVQLNPDALKQLYAYAVKAKAEIEKQVPVAKTEESGLNEEFEGAFYSLRRMSNKSAYLILKQYFKNEKGELTVYCLFGGEANAQF